MPDVKTLDESVGFYSITRETSPEIKSELAEQGYDVPLQPQIHHGGGGYATFGPLIVGGEGNGGGMTHRTADHEIDYGSGLGFYTVGWLLKHGLFRIYPLIGFGGVGNGANVRADNDETTQLMPSPDAKSTTLQIATFNPAMSLSIGFEMRILWFVIGIRVGYVFMPLGEHRKGKPYLRVFIGGKRNLQRG